MPSVPAQLAAVSAPQVQALNMVWISAYQADVCTAGSAFFIIPSTGKVEYIRMVCHADATTADTNFTVERDGTAVSGWTLVLDDADTTTSAAGEFYQFAGSAFSVVEGDIVEVVSDGAGSGTVPATFLLGLRILTA